jgi:hypothetical protein
MGISALPWSWASLYALLREAVQQLMGGFMPAEDRRRLH